ncbi:hypothetical protein [Planosporangium mesophilum]|nr:hypothetical protein [Planosporangium mesophilum]NJC85080.1 hypothetical protein [Planosporangium mesophilum]
MMNRPRAAALVAGAVLGLTLLTGCSSEGASTDCSLDACTVTFDRGVNASASVLGVEAKLVAADDQKVTVEVAGQQLSLTVGQPAVDAGAVSVSLESVTDSNAVVRIARG